MTLTTVDLDAYPEVGRVSRPTATSGAPYRYTPRDAVAPLRILGSGDPSASPARPTTNMPSSPRTPRPSPPSNRHLAAKIDEHIDEIESVSVSTWTRMPTPSSSATG